MSDCLFRRARSRAQKARRQEDILDAAAGLLETQPLHAIKLTDIAARAGVTKAALYRYFASREALFLALYLREGERLLARARADRGVEPAGTSAGRVSAAERTSKEDAAEFLAHQLIAAPLFCRLTAVLHTVLEQNLDVAAALTFKHALLTRLGALAGLLGDRFDLDASQARQVLLFAHQIVIGAWATAHPPPAVAQVLREPPLDVFSVDFATSLTQQLRCMVAGL